MIQALLVALLLCSLAFSLVNGMNDVSGMVATLVATRALPLRTARRLAVVGIWTGVLLGGSAVARTVALDIVNLTRGLVPVQHELLCWLGGVSGALFWGLAARRFGIPTSATHAFIGSLCGSTLASTGRRDLVHWGFAALRSGRVAGVMKVFAGLLLSPIVGLVLGFILFKLLAATFRHASLAVNARLRRMECAAVFLQCYSYGTNDAQGVMGILVGGMLSASVLPAFSLPLEVKLAVASFVGIGATIGSVQIMRRLGRGVFHARPAEALAGQSAAAVAVFGASLLGAPVSSTQVLSSALFGVGGAWRPRHVRWQQFREILLTWCITFPGALVVGFSLSLGLKWIIRP